MTSSQRNAFSRLLSAWRRHDDLRHQHTSIRDLAESRRMLDEARIEMGRSRIF